MNRSMLVMALAAGVLILLVVLFANPFKDQLSREDREWTGLFDPVQVAATDRVEIAGLADSTVLVKQGDAWLVASEGDFPADTAAVGNLLRSVKAARSAGVASSNPENRAMFQVDVTGLRVKLTAAGSPVAEFTLGKMGTDFTTSYVLPAGSDDVHVVRGMNKNLFLRPQGMRDRTLFHFEPAELAEVDARTPEGGWVLARQDTVWMVRPPEGAEAGPAQASVADQIVRTLADLAADGFADDLSDTTDTGLDAPQHAFTIRLMNGSRDAIRVGKKNDRNQYYVAREGQSVVYTLGEWRLTNLAKKYEELASPAPAGGEVNSSPAPGGG